MTISDQPNLAALSAVLPGTWELMSRVDMNDSGEPREEPTLGNDPIALLFYDKSGHFAAQFMKRDRSTAFEVTATGSMNNSRAQGGYDAYFGTYSVDDRLGTVTQRLLGALSQENVGEELTRSMEVKGNTLTIELQTKSVLGEQVKRTLIWRRVG